MRDIVHYSYHVFAVLKRKSIVILTEATTIKEDSTCKRVNT
jgi:hypothetical protein